MTRLFFVPLFACLACLASAQVPKDSELFQALKTHDSVFFARSFNLCDLAYLKKAVHRDLIFYHDQGGVQDKKIFLENVRKYICSDTLQKPIRKVLDESLEVFPMYQNGVLYGAIQTGVHDFYIREKGKADVQTSRAKFTHVYLYQDGRWLLKEVLSFDHIETPKAAPASTRTFEEEIEALLVREKVPALGLGIIEQGKLKKIQVFGQLAQGIPADHSTLFKVASLTKPITALVTLKLISTGALGLDEPLDKYWKDPDLLQDPRTQKLTPRILLSHQSGFPNWRYLNDDKKLAFEFEPGTRFQYSGEGFEYLRAALEAKFGRKLEVLADSLLFGPAKMRDTHFWWDAAVDESRYAQNHDQDGRPLETAKYHRANAAANLLTTVQDYGHFLAYVLNGAELSPAIFEEMTKSQVQLRANDYFGLGWEKLTGFSNGEYALIHTGRDPGVNTLAILFPQSKNGYVIFLNGDNALNIFEFLLTRQVHLGREIWDKR